MTTDAEQIIEALARVIDPLPFDNDAWLRMSDVTTRPGDRERAQHVARQKARLCLIEVYTTLDALGWQVVPVQATEAMTAAAAPEIADYEWSGTDGEVAAVFATMLAAAPKPPGAA